MKIENTYYKNESKIKNIKTDLRKHGSIGFFIKFSNFFKDLLISKFLFLKPKRIFMFDNKPFSYFYHPYNKTWKNERAIEIPIALSYLKEFKGKKILEIGNVLSHYVKTKHLILDKFEISSKVINQDVINFKSSIKFDLIISISTFEHIGIDDSIYNPKNSIKGIINIKNNCLSKDGVFLISFPVNYNPALTKLLEGNIFNYKIYCFKKINNKNLWKQCSFEEIKDYKHQQPVLGIIFLEIKKNTKIKC